MNPETRKTTNMSTKNELQKANDANWASSQGAKASGPIAGLVYVPRAVYYGPDHAHEGGGGGYATRVEAVALGATNIRSDDDGWLVADWPQHYFPAPSRECKCAACQAPGRWAEVADLQVALAMKCQLVDELVSACKLALGQMVGSKPLSGCHSGSLAADIRIVREAIAKAQGGEL